MLWLATGSGLRRLDPATGALSHFRHNADPDSLPTTDVNWSGEDSRGRFWVGTSQGLSEFDRASGKVLRHPADARLGAGQPVRRSHRTLATSCRPRVTALPLFDPDTNRVTPYSFYERDPGRHRSHGRHGHRGRRRRQPLAGLARAGPAAPQSANATASITTAISRRTCTASRKTK